MDLVKLIKSMSKRKVLLITLPVVFCLLSTLVLFTTRQKMKGYVAAKVTDFSGVIKPDEREGVYEGERVFVPDLALRQVFTPVLGLSSEERWVEVDLSEQKLRAWEGTSLFMESLVSTGLPWWPTPTGQFDIWVKLRATRMEGGEGRYYYNLPNVPYVMFFQNGEVPSSRGYSLHGAYWHNDFGRVHSHGCVNMPIASAENLYYWVSPVIPEGKTSVYASADNPGTRVVIHD